MARISSNVSSRSNTSREKPRLSRNRARSGVRIEHCVEACIGIFTPLSRASASTAGSCTISASAPALASASTKSPTRSSSSSKRMVLTVTKMRTPNRCAYEQSVAMSSTLLPASCLAPNSPAAIYTASAPQSMAAMPMSRVLAGASSSRCAIDYLSTASCFLASATYSALVLERSWV